MHCKTEDCLYKNWGGGGGEYQQITPVAILHQIRSNASELQNEDVSDRPTIDESLCWKQISLISRTRADTFDNVLG